MKVFIICSFLLSLAVSQINGQQQCVNTQCRQMAVGTNIPNYNEAIRQVQNSDDLRTNYAGSNNQFRRGKILRGKRDTGYGKQYKKPNQVIEHGKVIVMPPPGEAPRNAPQPGSKRGGGRPETMPYVAAMAPDGTVPIAVFPPFEKQPRYPARCVVFGQLTDYEDNDYGNKPLYKPTYEAHRGKRAANTTGFEPLEENGFEEELIHSLSKRESIFDRFRNSFSRPRRPLTSSSSYSAPPSSYAPPSYEAPKPTYAPPTEPPVKVVYRKFGYVCEITVSNDTCRIGTECDSYGRRLNQNQDNYGNTFSSDNFQKRLDPTYGLGDQRCTSSQVSCR